MFKNNFQSSVDKTKDNYNDKCKFNKKKESKV